MELLSRLESEAEDGVTQLARDVEQARHRGADSKRAFLNNMIGMRGA